MIRARGLLTLTLFLAPLAHATDGVIEISQAKVLAAGGHFPYVISTPGSYRLTSNLDVTADTMNMATAQNRTAIRINVLPVTIDLNGFTILGPTSCTGSGGSLSCSPTGTGSGIEASGAAALGPGIVIRNGIIQGMGGGGVSLVMTTTALVERVIVISNGGSGISSGGRVESCEALRNNGAGIGAISAIDSRSIENKTNGIAVTSLARGNISELNGGVGISAGSGASVLGNSASYNTGLGLSLSGAGYAQNVLVGNNMAGTQVSGGVQIGQNLCGGGLCP
jgi:hypothetical protein